MTVHAFVRARRDGGSRYRRQRLGHDYPVLDRPRWIHAASVGEVITVLPLLQAWLEIEAGEILVTTTTPTGAEVLRTRLGVSEHDDPNTASGVRVHHAYLPIDTPAATARFFAATRPRSAWIVETEIWPWLYAHCHDKTVPLTIINGRLSAKTRRAGNGFLGAVYARSLSAVRVLARTADDASAFVALGAPADAVETAGNLKLATRPSSAADRPAPTRLIAPDYCLAASTHADEEIQLVNAWLAQRDHGLLVLVPRHPERGPAIAQAIDKHRASRATGSETASATGSAKAPVAATPMRSRRDPVASTTRVYVADTLGELDDWFAHADAVFMGGSLITRGGHNLLEPARHGCAIVTGPHMQNFTDILHLLQRTGAIVQVPNAAEAVATLTRLQASETERQTLASGCAQALVEGEDVLATYIERLASDTR